MALEAVELVNQAEEKAREIIAAAQDQAKRMRIDAEQAGKSAVDAARTKARTESRQTLDAAQAKGEAAGAAALAKAKEDAAALKADAQGRLDAAAEEIVAKIKGGGVD